LEYVGAVPNINYFNQISLKDYQDYTVSYQIFDFKKISIDYCFKDIEILSQVLKNILIIISLYDKKIINNSYSFSSLAYKIYKKKFDKFKICIRRLKIEEYEYIKKSYFGGRCEVFGNPDDSEIIHHFDFSGMYAQCMLKKFPIGIPAFKTNNLNLNEIGLHSVKIFSNMEFPILPTYYNKKLLFLNGTYSGVFTHNELKLFIDNGGKVIEHYSSYVFPEEDYVFKDYSNEFINIRKKGLYYKIFGKIMNNGLYGSFALNTDDEETVVIFNEEELYGYLEHTNVKS
jgi:hypothetical protein